MRPVLIVVGLVLAQDLPQMGLVPDEGAVQELAPAAGFQNSVADPDLAFYAARSYSLMRPPTTDRRLIRSLERSATG